MQKKSKESWLKTYLKLNKLSRYVLFYVLGLIVYGIGSSLFLNQALLKTIVLTSDNLILKLIGMLFVITGVCILLFVFYQFYQRVTSKKSVQKAIIVYLLSIIASGLVLGLFGKAIFEYTSQDYNWVKQLIWILTTLIQGGLRFIFIYYCLTIYQEKVFNWQNPSFLKLLFGVYILLSLTILFNSLYPPLGSTATFVSDLIISTGIVYLEIFKTKKGSWYGN